MCKNVNAVCRKSSFSHQINHMTNKHAKNLRTKIQGAKEIFPNSLLWTYQFTVSRYDSNICTIYILAHFLRGATDCTKLHLYCANIQVSLLFSPAMVSLPLIREGKEGLRGKVDMSLVCRFQQIIFSEI